MIDLVAALQTKRQEINDLLAQEEYSIEQFSELWQEFDQSLLQLCENPQQIPDLQSILADNLQWVSLITEQVTSERSMVAVRMLQLRKGKKAHQSYGDNN
jgi:DNA-binding GntR family transcriptional regulator